LAGWFHSQIVNLQGASIFFPPHATGAAVKTQPMFSLIVSASMLFIIGYFFRLLSAAPQKKRPPGEEVAWCSRHVQIMV
jgi:hypothetical protein